MNTKKKNAMAMLSGEQRAVKDLFERYEALGQDDKNRKKKLADQICTALTLHATIEDEIFYPAVREAGAGNAEQVDEAIVEHASAKDLIAQLQEMDPDDALYDAKAKVLSGQIAHHVGEEEKEMFPKAKKNRRDLAALAEEMALRKDEVAATI
ncbi:hemerythrin domain-containing protein [Massilia antarctica]|uniref:hemerythrin domain-containing protein n=1 Tax=Massilia antarctica TaxID=2765360 RepID=UPI0006BB88E5|nr:hemerythrin domain-containing protein [Massilia sp. H27-R4]MCY0910561.1 hemerythrin domain-containing protein [Massilia sp. H27-R4]CUI09080.1 Regulator of cell morphogenesis and NO signaling [Janthinobacterium sp. CG23_2]CUU32866.1 Regulator of cell morphogenesis and NO signaling [Janthinobacterium sp. CG23_2]